VSVDLRILGSLELWVDGHPVRLPQGRQRALLALLVLRTPDVVSADAAADQLWPSAGQDEALRTLQVTVSRLRQSLGGANSLVQTVGSGYRLAVAPEVVDAERFRRLLREGQRARAGGDADTARGVLEQALALWRGRPLADVALESFAQADIARLEELRLEALEERVEACLAVGQDQQIVADLEKLVAEHPWRERLLCQLMVALYRGGRQADALAAYREGRRRLNDELGLEFSADVRRLEQAILEHDPSLGSGKLIPASASASGLPVPVTRLVGRGETLRVLETMLTDPQRRLVTVTGPGGVGKTRLALELAHGCAQRFSAGAIFVSLAELSRDDALARLSATEASPTPGAQTTGERLLMGAVARGVGASEQPGVSLRASVIADLSDKHLLLVLDNFEHLLDAAEAVSALLSGCPALKVLATSREALRVAGEHEFLLAPLALPDLSVATDRERLADNDAVALFVERTRAVQPSFSLSSENARAVAEVCVRLDGLPLALELAAARVKALSPGAMLARLERRLPLLTGGTRTAPERQRTLTAAVEWSYDLLREGEQRAFARLAVFRGGFTLEAAEDICDVSFDAVCSLLDKSLLSQADDRFSMLRTIREYAEQRLAQVPDQAAVRQRHGEWVTLLFEHAEPQLYGRDAVTWLQGLELEHDNLRGALDHARAVGDRSRELRLLAACSEFWYRRGYYAEGAIRLETALRADEKVPPALQRVLLNALFQCYWYHGQTTQAANCATRSLHLRNELPADRALLRSLINAAVVASETGDYTSAERLSLECVSLASALDDRWCRAVALTNLADAALQAGDYRDAASHATEAAKLRDEISDTIFQAVMQSNLAAAELELGQTESAIQRLQAALRDVSSDPSPQPAYYIIEGLATALTRRGQARPAARLIGIADGITARTDLVPQGFERRRRKQTLATLTRQLDPATLARARAEGATLSLPNALQYALEHTAPHHETTPA
jgi:predicted ATPase/DNA-binding SARP family transcriptional activator